MDESKLSILEKTGSTDVQELVAEVRRLRRDLEGTEGTAALTVSAQDHLAAEVHRMRVQLGGLKGWCERNGHDYALSLVLAALGSEVVATEAKPLRPMGDETPETR